MKKSFDPDEIQTHAHEIQRWTRYRFANWELMLLIEECLIIWKIEFLLPWWKIKKNYQFPIRINLSKSSIFS